MSQGSCLEMCRGDYFEDPPLKSNEHVMPSFLLLISCLMIYIQSWLEYRKVENVCTAIRIESALSTSRTLCKPAS